MLAGQPLSYWLAWIAEQYDSTKPKAPKYVVEALDEAIALLRQKRKADVIPITRTKTEQATDTFGFRQRREGEAQTVDTKVVDLDVVVDMDESGLPIYSVKIVGDRSPTGTQPNTKLRDYTGTFKAKPGWLEALAVGDLIDLTYVRTGENRVIQQVKHL